MPEVSHKLKPVPGSPEFLLKLNPSAHQAHDQTYQEDDHKYGEQDLSDGGSTGGNSAKPKYRRYYRHYEEDKSPP
jgi:hypothetical protein